MRYLNFKKALEAWNSLQPLSERDRERLNRRFTIDFNYNSNHIEGNTLTYGQTELLLLFGKMIGEAEIKDVQEMTASNVGLKIYWLDGSMTTSSNAIRASKRGVVVSSNDGIVSVSGLEDNENVQFYDVAGKLLGNARAIQGTAQFAVNTTASILIVMVGDNSLKINIK